MEAEMALSLIQANALKRKIDCQPLGCPNKPFLLQGRAILPAIKVIVEVASAGKLGAILPDEPHELCRAQAEAAIAYVHAVFVPPRSADVIVIEEFVPPHNRICNPAVPLDR